MAKARKFNIEMTYLHVGGEELEEYACIDEDDVETKKEPSPDVPYVGVPVTPAPCPGSEWFYDERLPAQESSGSAVENIELKRQTADEKVHKYLEIVHDVSTKQEQSPVNVLQAGGPDEPVQSTSSDWFNERPPYPRKQFSFRNDCKYRNDIFAHGS